jgi:hypothetical protein
VNRPVRAGGLLYVVVAGKPLAILTPTTGAVTASGAPYKAAKGHVVPVGGRLYTTDGTTLRTYTP